MPTATLFRLSGAVLTLGAMIGAIVVAIHPHELTDPIDGPVHLALFCGDLLVLLALPAVLARQAGRISILGSIGYVLVFIGLAFDDITHSVLEFSVVPVLASDPTTRPMLAPDSATSVALIHGPFGLMLAFGLPLIAMGLLAFNGHAARGCAVALARAHPSGVRVAAAGDDGLPARRPGRTRIVLRGTRGVRRCAHGPKDRGSRRQFERGRGARPSAELTWFTCPGAPRRSRGRFGPLRPRCAR